MITASSPWEFNDNDASLVSPDGKNKIRYVDLQEVQAGRVIIPGKLYNEFGVKCTIKNGIDLWCKNNLFFLS